jgi:hypothetical protein
LDCAVEESPLSEAVAREQQLEMTQQAEKTLICKVWIPAMEL